MTEVRGAKWGVIPIRPPTIMSGFSQSFNKVHRDAMAAFASQAEDGGRMIDDGSGELEARSGKLEVGRLAVILNITFLN